MKIFLKRALFLMCALTLVFGLVGCPKEAKSPSGGNGGGTTESVVQTVPNPELNLADGVTLFPANKATDAYADTDLMIKFDSTPVVADNAQVVIKCGDTVVDTINANSERLITGNNNGTIGEIGVGSNLIQVIDNVLLIKLHNAADAYGLLEDGTEYSVTVTGVTGKIGGADFDGSAEWKFTTKAAVTITDTEITVGHNGTEDFYSINGALNYVRENGNDGEKYTIKVAEGSYIERVFYNGVADILITGDVTAENARGKNTIIYWKNYEGLGGNTGARARSGFFLNGNANVDLRYITITNTADRTTDIKAGNAQAEAFSADISGNLTAYQCSFVSHQDTLYIGAKGNRSWFYDCYIEGDTDYIWGYGDVVLVENCDLRCVRDTYVDKQKSYIFASRTYDTQPTNKGFILKDSRVSIDKNVTAWYGRDSAGNGGSDTQALVMNTAFSGAGTLDSTLWSEFGFLVLDPAGDPAIAYKDYNNTWDGKAVDTTNRLANTWEVSERVINREYDGHFVIFNRGYDTEAKIYKSTENIWDVSEYYEEFGIEAEDKSLTNIYVEPVYVKNIVGGNTAQLTVTGGDADDTYTFESSDNSLATVDANGLVTTIAGANGTATITVTSSNGEKDIALIKVIPVDIPAESVAISLSEGDTLKYGLQTANITFTPEDTTDKTVTITSDNDKIKFVTTNGLVNSFTGLVSEVQFWLGGDITDATLTVSSDAYEAAVDGTTKVSTKADVAVWTPESAAVRVATDIQSGTIGLWDGLVIDSRADGNIITENGKMSMKGGGKMQIRNVTLYIPVKGASDIILSTTAEAKCTYSIGDSKEAGFTKSDDGKKLTYSYDGSKTGIVLGNEIKDLTFKKVSEGTQIDPNEKYLKVNVIKSSSDDYLTEIKVVKTGDFNIPAESIVIAPTTATVLIGETTALSATLTPSDTTDAIIWQTSDENVATVDDNGVVTGIAAGNATITAIAGQVGASCEVTVSAGAVAATGITLDKTEATLEKDTTLTLTATVTPSDSTDAITWTTSDENVATVANGVVTAVGVGEATITATAGEVNATCAVTVVAYANGTYTLSDSTISQGTALSDGTSSDGAVSWSGLYSNGNDYAYTTSSSKVTVQVAGSSIITLTGCYKGTNGKTLTVTDSSSNTVISGVYTSSEQILSFLYSGDATTLTIAWSGQAYITAIQVDDGTGVSDEITDVTISGTTTCTVGATINLSATVSCSYINTDTSVTWSSSDETIATVDDNGVVTSVAAGTAKITATSVFDSTKSGSIDIEVSAEPFDATNATVSIDLSSNDINIQSKKGTIPFTVKGSTDYDLTAYVDATTTSGKLAGDGTKHAQMNAGTVIKVPVSDGAVVSVTASSAGAQYALYTIAGTAASTTELTSTYTHSGDATWIDIISTGTAYPAAIEITGLNLENNFYGMDDYIWTQVSFASKSTDENKFGFEGNVGEFYGLVIDATSGKYKDNGSGWIQCNTGTIVYVPVIADATIVVSAYATEYPITGGESTALTDNGDKTYTYNFVYETDAVEVEGYDGKFAKLTMGTSGYWGDISLEY